MKATFGGRGHDTLLAPSFEADATCQACACLASAASAFTPCWGPQAVREVPLFATASARRCSRRVGSVLVLFFSSVVFVCLSCLLFGLCPVRSTAGRRDTAHRMHIAHTATAGCLKLSEPAGPPRCAATRATPQCQWATVAAAVIESQLDRAKLKVKLELDVELEKRKVAGSAHLVRSGVRSPPATPNLFFFFFSLGADRRGGAIMAIGCAARNDETRSMAMVYPLNFLSSSSNG
jgi:hypothetical protein